MHLTSLYTIEQLRRAMIRQYGAEALIKATEAKDSEGQDVITITVVKAAKPKQPKEPTVTTETARPYANLISAEKTCARLLKDTANHYEGWSNSATWAFDLYFMQERPNYEALCAIIRRCRKWIKEKKLTDSAYHEASRLMKRVYNTGKMVALDGDESGPVNVREIVDTLAEGLTD